jgi:flagellar biosynthesis activator protein FlaF
LPRQSRDPINPVPKGHIVNATEQARQAYSPAQSPSRTGRSAELQVFTQATSRLRAAMETSNQNFPRFALAIHENRQLWTRLAADVAEPGNALSPDLRAQIFYLAEFTAYHSSKVLQGKASAAALIDINTAVMRGLAANTRPAVS